MGWFSKRLPTAQVRATPLGCAERLALSRSVFRVAVGGWFGRCRQRWMDEWRRAQPGRALLMKPLSAMEVAVERARD